MTPSQAPPAPTPPPRGGVPGASHGKSAPGRGAPGSDGSGRRPLRVLDVTDCYSNHVSGGVKTYLHAKADAFAEATVDHAVVVPGPETDLELRAGSRFHRLPGFVVPVSRDYRFMLSPERLRDVVWRELPDIVEVGSPFIVPWLVDRAVRGLPVRTVGFYHTDLVRTVAEPYVPKRIAAPLRVLTRTLARQWVRHVYARFDVTVASSPSVAAELRELGLDNVRHVPLGVDLETFRPLPRNEAEDLGALGVEEGVPVGIFAGRFCAEKRLDVVLEAHASMPPAERPHLLLVGGGPHLEILQRRAARQARLSLHPYVHDREELAGLYGAADFYVAPGPGETFGLSIAEAMACGLPVVAVDRGAAPDRVRGSGAARLYRHGDVRSARAALEAMGQGAGPELRSRARAHAAATASWSRTFEALLDVYREVMERPPSSQRVGRRPLSHHIQGSSAVGP